MTHGGLFTLAVTALVAWGALAVVFGLLIGHMMAVGSRVDAHSQDTTQQRRAA